MNNFEWNITNPKAQGMFCQVFYYLKYFFAFPIGITLVYFLLYMPWGGGLPQIFSNVLIISISLGANISIILYCKALSERFFDLDYFIIDGLFRVVKVIRRSKRRVVLEMYAADIVTVGAIGSDTYISFADQTKKIDASCEYSVKAKKSFAGSESANWEGIFIYGRVDGKNRLVLCECNFDFVQTLRRVLKRELAFDRSIRELSCWRRQAANSMDKQADICVEQAAEKLLDDKKCVKIDSKKEGKE